MQLWRECLKWEEEKEEERVRKEVEKFENFKQWKNEGKIKNQMKTCSIYSSIPDSLKDYSSIFN